MKEILLVTCGLVMYVIYCLTVVALWHYSIPMALGLIAISALTIFILVLKYMESDF